RGGSAGGRGRRRLGAYSEWETRVPGTSLAGAGAHEVLHRRVSVGLSDLRWLCIRRFVRCRVSGGLGAHGGRPAATLDRRLAAVLQARVAALPARRPAPGRGPNLQRLGLRGEERSAARRRPPPLRQRRPAADPPAEDGPSPP